jgi:hypothetical protein
MNSVRYWQIHPQDETFDEDMDTFLNETRIKEGINKSFSLTDQSETTNNFIKKFITETTAFHLSRIDIENNIRNFNVIFSINSNTNSNFKTEGRINESTKQYEYPVLSINTYISDDYSHVNVFTEMNLNDFNYKKFTDQKSIFFNSPLRNTQLTFDGRKMSGILVLNEPHNLIESFSIKINVFNKPEETHVINNCDSIRLPKTKFKSIESKENIITQTNDAILNWNFFNNVLYNKKLSDTSILVCGKCVHFLKSEEPISTNTRFIQRFKIENVFQDYILKWITHEISTSIGNKNDSCNLQSTPSILNFLLFVSTVLLLPKICEFYNLDKKCNIDITDMIYLKVFVLKEIQHILDKSKSVIIIGLSGVSTLSFEDGIQLNLSPGEALVYTGYIDRKMKVEEETESSVIIITTGAF